MKEINHKCLTESAQFAGIQSPGRVERGASQAPKRCNCISCKRLKVRRKANAR